MRAAPTAAPKTSTASAEESLLTVMWTDWSVPAAPTAAQKTALEVSAEESLKRAAATVAQADVMLLLTGAGWSADSGLAVYRDVANVEAYRARGVDYADLCDPELQDDDAELFMGFWGRCFNDYRDTQPHEGYATIRRWRDEHFAGTETARRMARHHRNGERKREDEGEGECEEQPASFFSFTSNVDAHHLRIFPAAEVRECHGNSETWQCSDYECAHGRGRGAYRSGTGACASNRWTAPAGYRFAVDATTQLASAARPPARAVEATRSSIGVQSFHQKNHPTCPQCGKPARPAILMFCDGAWRDDDEQEARWERWMASLQQEQQARVDAWLALVAGGAVLGTTYASATNYPDGTQPLRVAIMEVGAGENVNDTKPGRGHAPQPQRQRFTPDSHPHQPGVAPSGLVAQPACGDLAHVKRLASGTFVLLVIQSQSINPSSKQASNQASKQASPRRAAERFRLDGCARMLIRFCTQRS